MAFLSILAIIAIAVIAGKLISYIKLPSILGWLIVGMIFGPNLVALVSTQVLESSTYEIIIRVCELLVGIYFLTQINTGSKEDTGYLSGRSLLTITAYESVITYLVVALVFMIVFATEGIPMYLAFIFGGIALATAPAPSISVVNQYKANGPVAKALVPIAMIDDIFAFVFFFGTIAVVGLIFGTPSAGAFTLGNFSMALRLLPYVICVLVSLLNVLLVRKLKNEKSHLPLTLFSIVLLIVSTMLADYYADMTFSASYMLIGILYCLILKKGVGKEKMAALFSKLGKVLELSMVVVILDLGMPLDYKLILGASLYTVIYIVSRAAGKILGAFTGAKVVKADKNVSRYLGLALLPHSGVSLIFTSIAVGTLSSIDPTLVPIIQGTIAAAAVINEIIAVILAKFAFKWAGEIA